MRRPLASIAPLVLLAGVVAGCGAQGTGPGGYISGDGIVNEVPPGHRRTVGSISGETLDGRHVDVADYRGKVVVLNVWGSWCADCRLEAATLAQSAKELARKGVVFLGINTRDASKDNARAYDRRYGVTYPSIYDRDGQNLLAFHGTVAPNAIPSTIVLDPRGGIAASINGPLTSKTTLADLVADARKVPRSEGPA